MDVTAKVKEIIVQQLGVDAEKVIPEASFVDDLGADSLDVVELVMAFEEEFGVEIPDPAEELFAGKMMMVQRGGFDDLDAAVIVHPETFDMATGNALACQNLYIEFFGKAAHASASPERGTNALDAIINYQRRLRSLEVATMADLEELAEEEVQ